MIYRPRFILVASHPYLFVYYRRLCIVERLFFFLSWSKIPVCASGNAAVYCCLTASISSPPVDNIDVSSTANLYKSLAQAAPEIKQCVDACNFIAESTRQQNNIGSVSIASHFICHYSSCLYFLFHVPDDCYPNSSFSFFTFFFKHRKLKAGCWLERWLTRCVSGQPCSSSSSAQWGSSSQDTSTRCQNFHFLDRAKNIARVKKLKCFRGSLYVILSKALSGLGRWLDSRVS